MRTLALIGLIFALVLNTLAPNVLAQIDERLPVANPKALRQAHAHNDYLHQRPLKDALGHGFCSVEADIFLVGGELWIGHERSELEPDRTLEKLYLEPLRQRAQANGGFIHEKGVEFILLIDIKTEAESTYRRLAEVLRNYRSMLTEVVDDRAIPRAVTVIVSGNRPWELIASQQERLVGVDGRLSDLDSDLPGHLLPLISDRWTSHFQWNGEGQMSDEEEHKLQAYVQAAHAAGRKIRFWATPDAPALWSKLCQANVDLINTDDLAGLRQFLTASR